MAKYYVGITIGPIAETMSYSSAPGALWYASFFFSSITNSLCRNIEKVGGNILTVRKKDGETDWEYYDEAMHGNLGVFHDRIYYANESYGDSEEQKIREDVASIVDETIRSKAAELAGYLSEENVEAVYAFLKNYLQIHYIVIADDGREIGSGLSHALDALEICNEYRADLREVNYLKKIMDGTRAGDEKSGGGNNAYVRKAIKTATDGTGLCDGMKIKSILDIATSGLNATKVSRYYAIVYADGDNMGKILNMSGADAASQEGRIAAFSKLCTDYTGKAREIIRDYNGVIIYAGGDDLLFLVPVLSAVEKNVLTLCREISDAFDVICKNWVAEQKLSATIMPSVSFGISVNYDKYPINEALADARGLLFGCAKKYGAKNNVAIAVRKASGQSQGVVCKIKSDTYKHISDIFKDIYAQENSSSQEEDVNELLHSITYHLAERRSLYEAILNNSNGSDELRRLYKKHFGYSEQTEPETARERQLSAILQLALHIQGLEKQEAASYPDGVVEEANHEGQYAKSHLLVSILRMAKFLIEENKDER